MSDNLHMDKRVVPVVVGLVIAIAFAANTAFVEHQADATSPFPSREKVITVTGSATASIEPDLLVVTFGVETEEKTAAAALSANSAAMTSAVDVIRSLDIPDDELSTSRLSIYPVYNNYEDPFSKRYVHELVGYKVTNMLTVQTPQLGMAADIIDGAVSAGVNRVDSVYFTTSPQRQLDLKDELLSQAVLNAKQKAENALAPLGHKITGVKSVNLSEYGTSPVPMYSRGVFAEEAALSAPTPVFASDLDITTTANVTFLIGSN